MNAILDWIINCFLLIIFLKSSYKKVDFSKTSISSYQKS